MTQKTTIPIILVFLFVTPLFLTFVSSQDPNLYYFCTDVTGTNDWLLDVYVRKNAGDMNQMFGVDLSSGASMKLACDATPFIPFPPINPTQEVTGDGTDADPFTIRITTNKLTRVPSPACGSEVSNPATVRVNFQPVSASSPVSWEVQHALTCDYSNTATTQTDTVFAVATITGETVTVIDLGDPLVLQVLNPRGQVVTEVTTNEIFLKAEFFSGPDVYTPLANVTGISPHSCKICDTKDCSGGLVSDITDANGCPVGNYFMSSAFTGDGVVLKSSLLTLTSVSSYSYIYFNCAQDYCTEDTGLKKCKDRCSNLNGRKRRELNTGGDPYGAQSLYWSQRVLYNATDPVHDCPSHTTLTILVAVLSTIFISAAYQGYSIKNKSLKVCDECNSLVSKYGLSVQDLCPSAS
ncbi:uncharacterized protein LOC135470897 [Liolophura sinensis]|uniref:uncharacterized protein LOC135470897 n=1 Tax=Liolophura sinensis TaxID=3198878 RepID=UPI00315879CA